MQNVSVSPTVMPKVKSNFVMVNVKGKQKKIFLLEQLSPNKWRARARVPMDFASIRGIFQVYANGAKRFTPTGPNGKYL